MAHVFLSYSRKDLEFMRRLRDDLLKEGLGVWTDDIGLEPGTPNWENAIANALNQAGCMVVVLSPDAAQSKWVGIEVAFADERGVRIFPLLARGDPRDAVPFRLTTCQRVDARGDYQRALQQLIPAVCEHLAIESISEKPSVSTEVGHLSHLDEVQRREEVASHAFLEAEAPTPQAEQGRVTYEEAVESALREADARRRSQAGFEARRREAGAPTPQQAEEGRARHREAVESALREADTRRRRQAEDKARRREEKARPAIREAEAPTPQPEQGRTKYQEAVKAALHEADKKRANRSH